MCSSRLFGVCTSVMAAEMAVAAQANGETIDSSTIMTNRSKEVKMTFCQLCEGQHDYLAYCEQFRKNIRFWMDHQIIDEK